MALIKRLLWLTCVTLLAVCTPSGSWTGQVVPSSILPAGVVTVHDGQPAMEFDTEAGWTTFLTYAGLGREPALQVDVNGKCEGRFYLTAQRIGFTPDRSSSARCARRTFIASRSDVRDFEVDASNYDEIHFHLGPRSLTFDVTWQKGAKRDWAVFGRMETEAPSALEDWLYLAWKDFPSAVVKFDGLTRGLSVPLSPDESAAVSAKQSAGDAAGQAGKLYDALQDYQAALQVLPAEWAPQDVEQRLEEKAIKLVLRMNPRPAIPQDAMRHMAYAETAFQEAKGPADLDNAIQELNKALRLAPWWGDAYKNLGLLYEKEQRYADATRNLQLYLLATPNAPDAQSVQMKIYSLQYKAKQQTASN